MIVMLIKKVRLDQYLAAFSLTKLCD